MLLPLKLICDPKKIRRDGSTLIYIQYCFSAERRTLLNTEISIPATFWNKKKLCISKDLPVVHGDATGLNEDLKRMYRIAEDIISYAIRNKIEDVGNFVKKIFHPHFNTHTLESLKAAIIVESFKQKEINKDLFFQIDEYIESKKRKVCKGMLGVYGQLKGRLRAFESFRKRPITFDCMDYNFYDDFIEFLTFHYEHKRRQEVHYGLKVNTIGQTIKQFRIFIKDRVRRKIIAPIDLTDFKISEEEADAIYLSHEEIGKIYRTDLSAHPYLAVYRDLFVLACLTGLRFSDLSILTPDDLRNDLLYKKQEKSEHWVVIPLRKEAKIIFSKQFKEKIPKLTNPEFNRHIKTIGKLAGINERIRFSYKKGNKNIEVVKPKYEWITSHTARRSFCTNEFLAGTPVKLVMKISGHKKEIHFYKYIRITPEEAAQKIKELWEERGGMEMFRTELNAV
ncbi:site-specific integrase [Segetibacter aerophilus]|uniref:Integrase n=1 Tax=Segetibacter aerophilus TaxID=670293 RepID=A0A512B9N9_9BACT|nr:site-specific integrase [Segetibacter aerophilus]GEO08659.1 integrase [Segetibacter aerophilus]